MDDVTRGKGSPAVASPFRWDETTAGLVLRCDALEPYATHAFTTRHLAFRDHAAENYARLGALLTLPVTSVITVSQVHGRDVLTVKPSDEPAANQPADAVITSDPDRAASVRVADCVPILLADRRHRAVAAVHAGWRGTVAGVAGAAVAALAAMGVPPGDLVAAIGPSIGPCCYQVGESTRMRFIAAGADLARWFVPDGPQHWKLDLWQANADQLMAAGLDAQSVHVARLCTSDNPDVCFSYRREGATAGRMVAAIRQMAS